MYTSYPKNIKSLVASFFVGLGLLAASCGGGGGGGGGGGSAPPPPPAPQATERTVSGSVLGLSTLVGTSQKAQEQTPQRNPLKDAVVEIVAYKKNCTQDCETGRLTLNTTEFGSFAGTLKLWSDGGYVVINVKKQGFVEWSRRIDFDKPADINITAELEKTMFAVARRGDAVFRTSTGERVFKFAVLKDISGRKMVKANRDVEIAKQNGQNLVLEITIPADSIPQDVTSLVASLKTFDPITQGDRFPGQYRDNKGRTIVSAGFDYINITDDNGRNLGEIVRQAIAQGKLTKAQTGGTYITRRISGDACKNILYDFCRNDKSAETGLTEDNQLCGRLTDNEALYVNVPIYTYNPYSGNWEMLGIGTIEGYSSVDQAKSICEGNGVSVSIRITNEDFSKYWWNLDYPLLTQQPKEICIDLTFKSNNGQPLQSVYVYLSDDDNTMSFSSAWGNTGSDGKVRLKTALFNNDEDRTATLYYYDPVTYKSEPKSVSLEDSPNCAQGEITVQTNLCTVTGRVLYEGNPPTPVSGQYVYAYSLDSYYWSYATTDREGNFTLNAICNKNHELYVNYISPLNLPNFRVSDGPLSLGDIYITNQPPYAYGWLSSTSVKVGGSVDVYIYGWDAECNTPLSWELRRGYTPLANGQWNTCWGDGTQSISFSSPGQYPISLVVTDSAGKSTTVNLGTVIVSENRAPVIQYAYPDRYAVYLTSQGRVSINLFAGAYDPDADPINAKWEVIVGNTTTQVCPNSEQYEYGSITLNCTYTDSIDPTQITQLRFRFTVNDNGGNFAREEFVVEVRQPSFVNIIIQSLRTTLFRR